MKRLLDKYPGEIFIIVVACMVSPVFCLNARSEQQKELPPEAYHFADEQTFPDLPAGEKVPTVEEYYKSRGLPPPPPSPYKGFAHGTAILDKDAYVPADTVGETTAELMGPKAPHILIGKQKLDYDPEQKTYCYAEVATKGPFAGKKMRALWMQYTDSKTKLPVFQLSGQPDQIDEATGLQYKRQDDGEWLANGQFFHKIEVIEPDGAKHDEWQPDVLCLQQIAMRWDRPKKTYYEYETQEPVQVVWVQEGGKTGWRTQKLIRTAKAHQLNPRPDDAPEPQK